MSQPDISNSATYGPDLAVMLPMDHARMLPANALSLPSYTMLDSDTDAVFDNFLEKFGGSDAY